MPSSPPRRTEPLVAGPIRQAVHTLVTLLGWCLFIWWWWIVMQRVDRAQVEFTAWFIALSLVVIVLTTALWAFHNVRLFRRRGPRVTLREVDTAHTHDTIGRPVDMPIVAEDCLTSREVVIRIEDGKKVYRTPGPSKPTLRVVDGGASGEVAS